MFEWLALLYSWWERVDHAVLAIIVIGATLYLRPLVHALRQERLDLEATVKTLGEHVKALRKGDEQGADENWEKIREIWAKTRDRIEYAIEEIDDGRKRRKYSNLPRYSYEDIISKLKQDLRLPNDVVEALQWMNATFLSLRSSKAAPAEYVNYFQEGYRRADRVFPKITGADD